MLDADGTTLALRDRLLASLLSDPSATLVQHEPGLASVVLGVGEQVVLIAVPPDPAPDALRELLAAIVRQSRAPVVHLAVIGGGREVADQLRRALPFWQIRRRFGAHRVQPDGTVEHVKGSRSTALRRAAEGQASAAPLAAEEVAARLAQGGERHGEVSRLRAALGTRFPWVTAAIAALCAILYVLARVWGESFYFLALYRMGANSGELVQAGEVWRVLSSAFLHGGVEHLLVNLIALASFGPLLERLLGSRRYLLLYGGSALGGGLASALLRGPGLAVGASGAIWGLMAAGIGLALRPRGLLPPLVLADARRRALVPLIINFGYSFMPGIDLYAHFGGGLVGLGLMLSGLVTRGVEPVWTEEGSAARREPRASMGLTLAAVAVAIALVGSVAVAIAQGRPWELGQAPELTRVAVADTGVSVEMPASIAGATVEQPDLSGRIIGYGTDLSGPIAVEVRVDPLPEEIPADMIDAALETLRGALQGAPPQGSAREEDARIVTIGARKLVYTRLKNGAVRVHVWVTLAGKRRVILRVLAHDALPAAWAGIPERIAASLAVP
jgi:membrane associated rhomboid family serine protease